MEGVCALIGSPPGGGNHIGKSLGSSPLMAGEGRAVGNGVWLLPLGRGKEGGWGDTRGQRVVQDPGWAGARKGLEQVGREEVRAPGAAAGTCPQGSHPPNRIHRRVLP